MNIRHRRFNVAWLDYSQPPKPPLYDAVSLPQLDCTQFSVERLFRNSFCKNHYDAILCSCESSLDEGPKMIVRWIRSVRCSQIPVLILADNVDELTVAEALYIGADDIQESTVFPAILNARVAGLCARAEKHRQNIQ
ncbi:MAG: hypothetical protein AB8B63_06600 [Granulosicoccus sp.]